MKVKELIGYLQKADPEMEANISIPAKHEDGHFIDMAFDIDCVWTEDYDGRKCLHIGQLDIAAARLVNCKRLVQDSDIDVEEKKKNYESKRNH